HRHPARWPGEESGEVRVLVAGATGVIGRRLVPVLVAAGHEVVGVARTGAVPARINPRRLARDFALTNRLRTEGTRHLLEAGATVGVRRFISQGAVHQPRAGVRVPARGEAGRRGRAAVDP